MPCRNRLAESVNQDTSECTSSAKATMPRSLKTDKVCQWEPGQLQSWLQKPMTGLITITGNFHAWSGSQWHLGSALSIPLNLVSRRSHIRLKHVICKCTQYHPCRGNEGRPGNFPASYYGPMDMLRAKPFPELKAELEQEVWLGNIRRSFDTPLFALVFLETLSVSDYRQDYRLLTCQTSLHSFWVIHKICSYVSYFDCPPLHCRQKSSAGKLSRWLIPICELLFFFSS